MKTLANPPCINTNTKKIHEDPKKINTNTKKFKNTSQQLGYDLAGPMMQKYRKAMNVLAKSGKTE